MPNLLQTCHEQQFGIAVKPPKQKGYLKLHPQNFQVAFFAYYPTPSAHPDTSAQVSPKRCRYLRSLSLSLAVARSSRDKLR